MIKNRYSLRMLHPWCDNFFFGKKQSPKKKLQKEKLVKSISLSAESNKTCAVLTARAFEKARPKLLNTTNFCVNLPPYNA